MSNNHKFITDVFENEIKTIVMPSIFKSLNIPHLELLTRYIIRLLTIVIINFGFYDTPYEDQLKQNNYQDIKWLVMHLLPFIDENNDISMITSLDDIYSKKKKIVDINKTEPSYLYSNLQYNRCNREDGIISERNFAVEDIEHNFYLLINTIKVMSHKMHVNWLDVLPVTMGHFRSTPLYKTTETKMLNKSFSDWDPVEMGNIHAITDSDVCTVLGAVGTGLSMDDIYNTIAIDLYDGIKDIKWMLYDIASQNKVYPIVFIMERLFNTKFCVSDITWEYFPEKEMKNFSEMWSELITTANNGNSIFYKDISIQNNEVRIFLRGIILGFDRSRHKKQALKEEYISVGIDKKNKDEDDDDEDETVTFDMVKKSLETIKPKFIYDFFRDSLQKFKNTWYGTKLLNDSKTQINGDFTPVFVGKDRVAITYKNIYNFSKSFCHYTEIDTSKRTKPRKFKEFPHHWNSLSKIHRDEILKRINDNYDNPTTWFGIHRYIKLLGTEKFPQYKTIDEINVAIYKNIRKILISVIFESLITKGVLTRFIPNKQKTNQKHLNRDLIYKVQGEVFEESSENQYWTHAYHYLTCLPYNQMKEFNTRNGKYNYFKFGKEKGKQWYSAYSYDWIAQIGFCHHFINNRVTFITGATGVGKSTEIPKLFLYWSKAINYKSTPRVICTQPRKAPTERNAEYVSSALGVPIFEFNGTKNTDSKYYYIQAKHKELDHTKHCNSPILEYSTDGTFILKINDPFMKEKINDVYTDENIYDIIMIDEAHEHKINMDMILTLLKVPMTLNNSLKLVILSATMDEDESKYRRYYRDINDNRKYPLDSWIADKKLDRINVDRRFHISPPGMGTKYVVTDIYTPGKTEIETIQQILKTSTEGEILVFQAGVAEITKLVLELNNSTPVNVIALPYHGQMSKDARDFVENIGDTLKTLRIEKNADFSKLTVFSNGTRNYSRAIIIATNAAEASITISSLKFVVETGTQKVQLYDHIKKGEKLIKTDISESSRIQRRGRVGRKSSGTVYYLYEKGKMEKNKTAYEISTSDLSLTLFAKLRKSHLEKALISETLDVNSPKANPTITDMKLLNKTSPGLGTVLLQQNFVDNLFYNYYGVDSFYDYQNYEKLLPYYESGYSFNELNDNMGKFYLIHPNELQLKRNINGKICEIVPNDSMQQDDLTLSKNTLYSVKMNSFWETMEYYLYISKTKGSGYDYTKTDIGTTFIKLYETMKIDDHGLFRALVFGIVLGCGEELFKLTSIYSVTSFNVLGMFEKVENRYDYSKIKSIVGDVNSDSIGLLNIVNEFHAFLEHLHIPTKLNSKEHIMEIDTNSMTHSQMMELLGPSDKYSAGLRKKITEDGEKKMVKELTDVLTNIFFGKISQNVEQIVSWCKIRGLDWKIMIKYISFYNDLRIRIGKIMTTDVVKLLDTLSICFKKTFQAAPIKLLELDSNSYISLALLMGFPFGICAKIHDKSYLSVANPYITNVYDLTSLSKYKFVPSMLVPYEMLAEYLLYLKINIEFDTVTCVHKIDPELFCVYDSIYPIKTLNCLSDIETQKKYFKLNSEMKIKNNTIDQKTSQTMARYFDFIEKMQIDLSKFNSKDNEKKLTKLLRNATIQLDE